MHIRILLIRHAIGMQEIRIIIIIKTWDSTNRTQVQNVTQKQWPFHFKLKKTLKFLQERGPICFNIIFKPKATFSFDHMSVFMLIFFWPWNSHIFTNTGYAMKTKFLLANLLLGYVVLAFGIELKYIKYCGKW